MIKPGWCGRSHVDSCEVVRRKNAGRQPALRVECAALAYFAQALDEADGRTYEIKFLA